MICQRFWVAPAVVVLLWGASLLLSAGAAAQEAAQSELGPVSSGTAAPDVWPEYALPDDEAARQGRVVMPFTQDQIEALGLLLRQTQWATQLGVGVPARGRIRRVHLAEPGAGEIPVVAVRRGYTTVLSFTDMTGAPWPIEEVLVERAFLPETQDERTAESAHLLYLAPRQLFLEGNVVIKLAGLAEPVVAVLSGSDGEADFRVDVRLGVPGPNAEPAMLVLPGGFHAGDMVLLGLLGGVVPGEAERLAVSGGGGDERAWRLGEDVLLVSRAHLLSPGPWAAERGPGGRWAYRLPATPYALMSLDGRETRLGFQRVPDVGLNTAEEFMSDATE